VTRTNNKNDPRAIFADFNDPSGVEEREAPCVEKKKEVAERMIVAGNESEMKVKKLPLGEKTLLGIPSRNPIE
jgi:hypothetical protein